MGSESEIEISLALSKPVERGDVPGAAALVDWDGEIVFRTAVGHARLSAPKTAMRADHRFDLASLTKVVATLPAILCLVDDGKIKLDDPLSKHLPELDRPDKKAITIRQCLTHVSGLPASRGYYKTMQGKDAYLRAIAAEKLQHKPGSRYVYSDLGFILLGFLVERVAQEPLSDFVDERIFHPLGMDDTGFVPVGAGKRSAKEFAATEICRWRKRLIVGEVHDENAYALGGVAGHAGLFSTVDDLGRFGRMLLDKGECDGKQILSPQMVSLFNKPQIADLNPQIGLGWRLRSSLESRIGFLASPRSFGHTGFTGTTLWIDPDNRVVATLLTNAIHPSRAEAKREGIRLGFHRAVTKMTRPARSGAVKTGLDVLSDEGFERLRGLRVALTLNHTAVDRDGKHLIDLLREHPEIDVAAIFTPEHGFLGSAAAGSKLDDSRHDSIPVYSLYGKRRKPDPATADSFDVMLFDIQDVGARFYTYISTMFNVQQFCAEHGKRLIVLDRPNPIGGDRIEGPVLDEAQASFVGIKPLPIRHSLTVGELATMFNQQGWLGQGLKAELEVARMEGWRREMWFVDTGLPWVAPSPNMPTWDTATVYPGTCLLEGTSLSEGRGTLFPFENVGGPGIDADDLARRLNARGLPGCRWLPTRFTPMPTSASGPNPKHKDRECGGVFIRVDDREDFQPVKAALALLIELKARDAFEWREARFDRLMGIDTVRHQIDSGVGLDDIVASWREGLEEFERICRQALIYD